MCPEFVLPVSEEEYEKAGSKFIAVPKMVVNELHYRDIEMDMPDWDTPGQSMKWPIRIIEEGPDLGKEDKLSSGVDALKADGSLGGLWKTKDILKAFNMEPEMRTGADKKKHPVITNEMAMAIAGAQATGCWQIQMDKRSAEQGGKGTLYPKLISIYPAGYKPEVTELV